MKLKKVLLLAFLALTLLPIIIVSSLLYQSWFTLSKESYIRNLIESITVQEDYISQTIENNMIADYRFINRNYDRIFKKDGTILMQDGLFTAFQSYLSDSEDRIAVTMLLNKDDVPIYTIGEKVVLDVVGKQLPQVSSFTKQTMMEFELGQGIYSLGIITPITDASGTYVGGLVSVYDKAYIFKIISSYYKVANTSIYLCRSDGSLVHFRRFSDEEQSSAVEKVLDEVNFQSEGVVDKEFNNTYVTGYYRKIQNSPWVLMGFIDQELVYSFTQQFIWIYVGIIFLVLFADIVLAVYFSRRVVEPINRLIGVMEDYQSSLNRKDLEYGDSKGYFETNYLWDKFLSLMNTILRVQHNFAGIYQLYQSSDMGDTNIEIDTKMQTVCSNKEELQKLMNEISVPEGACVVERFTRCFCEKDQLMMFEIFENMRDEHLSVTREADVYTSYLGEKWFHVLVVPIYEDERLSRLFIQLRDISRLKKQEVESFEQARRDALTGLYNRAGFAESIKKVLTDEKSTELKGLLFIDMNYFKMVNDTLGHSAGDDLLCAVGRTLLHTVGAAHIVSRFGGDEFAVFMPNTSHEEIESVKENLGQRLVFPFQTEEVSFVVSASIGVATANEQSSDMLEKMLQQADASM